ncbi:MAG: peptide chain release factor N(5)-glutamine methyltransferase [Gemmatimonadota bacterium]|nr:MAG: peptide chain release factor N(5)-glutamine methyltransferase [Gemmatimonadota bacterium]
MTKPVVGRPAREAGRAARPSRRAALDGVAGELRAAGIEAARLEAERLLAFATGTPRGELLQALGSALRADEARALAVVVQRRLAGEPLQHIEGTVEFRELELHSDPRAFIPRPETEQLVERVLRWARERGDGSGGVKVVRRPGQQALLQAALDIGTGSGAIALSLAYEGIAARVIALDRSAAALEQAAENRAKVGVTASRVELRRVTGSLWAAVEPEERFDLIVSNPPYVADNELAGLPREVRHDPVEALEAGVEGLDVVREVVGGAWAHLHPGGAIFLEIGEGQGESVRSLLAAAGAWSAVEVEQDLAGRVRFAFALRGRASA